VSKTDAGAPCEPNSRKQRRYRGHSLILETEVETADGAATLVEFMRPRGQTSDLVRLVIGRRAGRVPHPAHHSLRLFRLWCPRALGAAARRRHTHAISGPDMVVLRTPVALCGEGMTTAGRFTAADETVPFVLSYGPPMTIRPRPSTPSPRSPIPKRSGASGAVADDHHAHLAIEEALTFGSLG
jgi:hypothetical protein